MEIDGNSKDIIKMKLGQMKVNYAIKSFNLNFETKNVNLEAIDLDNAKELKRIWQDIAKLSLGGYNDFVFFQQMHIQDIHNSQIYNTAMQNLGYQRSNNNVWKLMRQPNEDIVIENIYKYCFYRYIVREKTSIPTSAGNQIICEYCDNINTEDSQECYVCMAELPHHHVKYIDCSPENGIMDSSKKILSETESYPREAAVDDDDVIICGNCSIKNKSNDKFCSVCYFNIEANIPKETNQEKLEQETLNDTFWSCPSCTFKNKIETKCCEACLTIRGSGDSSVDLDFGSDLSSIVDEPTSTWNCKNCRSLNASNRYNCSSCNQHAPFFHKWVCPRCSFFNDENVRICVVCEEIKEENNNQLKSLKSIRESMDSAIITMCTNCKKLLKPSEHHLCRECSDLHWYCNNRFCSTIIYKDIHYCPNCKLKRGSNITKYNMVDVFNGNGYIKRAQCPDCGSFGDGVSCGTCGKKWDLSAKNKLVNLSANAINSFKKLFK